jgi:hypothetical protein
VRSPYASSRSENQHCAAATGGIVARLDGSDTCTALGLTAQSSSPVLLLCRRLLDAGYDPTLPLHVFRGALALIVRSIGEAARLRVGSHGVGFEVDPECGASPPIAPTVPVRARHRARRAA